MMRHIKDFFHFFNTCYENFTKNKTVRKIAHILSDCPTYKKTVLLILGYVFLFYLPFTFMILVFRQVIYFQGDHLYQFSTIIFDFRNRMMDLNFSTWDFKNGLGYDYFANFYYIPLDFSLIPYFIFPFLTFSQQMWLSFLLKVLVGTFAFSYLLKLYKLNNKTILFTSVLYGTADLFFAQNVFASYSGLIYYIPLLLIAIELIFKKKNYLFFSFSIFQIFLFNSYWSYALTIFMSIALLLRTIFHFITFDNFYRLFTYVKIVGKLLKSICFYILGVGLAAFFVLPILNIMSNEPRMIADSGFIISDALAFDYMVYFKTFFKMLVPNLYMYSGFYYDKSSSYWLTTNHIIIYSSIMASFTLFSFIFTPSLVAKKRLTPQQFKTFIMLKLVTILTCVFMLIPVTSYLFSFNTSGYLRWFIFFGVLMIINLAFIIEYKLFNKYLFIIYLLLSIFYLKYSIDYNLNTDVHRATFFDTDYSVAYTMIIVYIIIMAFVILFFKKVNLSIPLLIERITLIGLILSICVTPLFSMGVRHADEYGKAANELMQDIELDQDYNAMFDSLYYRDFSDYEPMPDMAYLYDFDVYNNFNVFHSLINPYFTIYRDNSNHKRYYRALDVPYLYYRYIDPTLFIQSNSKTSGITNQFYPLSSELLAKKDFDEMDSYMTIYKREAEFSIGTGFTSYYTVKNSFDFDYLWLDSLYVKDEDLIQKLTDQGYQEEEINSSSFLNSVNFNRSDIEKEYKMEQTSALYFQAVNVDIKQQENDVVLLRYYYPPDIKAMYSVDQNDQINRCFNRFCFVPESGIKKLIVGTKKEDFYISSVDFYTLDHEKMTDKVNKLKEYSTYDVKIDKNTITSKVNNDQPLLMQYKIGYAKGWDAYVDGEKVEAFPSHGGMLSFMLEDVGNHEIELKYQTPWLSEGIIISLGSAGLFILLLIIKLHKIKKYKLEEFIKFVVVGVLATLINYGIYYLLQKLISPTISYTVGYIVSFGFNFLASNLFTFKTKVNKRTGFRFLLAHLTNYTIQVLLLNLFIFLQIPKEYAPIPVYMIAIPVNFLTVRFALKK